MIGARIHSILPSSPAPCVALDHTRGRSTPYRQPNKSSSLVHGVRREELPTAFHATFGIALFLMGNIMAQDASLALLDEPSSASTWWLAALDVFETGESLPCLIDGRGGADAAEDWRMAIAWGRTLVCLADEKISSAERAKAEAHARATSEGRSLSLAESWAYMADPGPFTVSEPTWPKDSVFYTIAMNRPRSPRNGGRSLAASCYDHRRPAGNLPSVPAARGPVVPGSGSGTKDRAHPSKGPEVTACPAGPWRDPPR